MKPVSPLFPSGFYYAEKESESVYGVNPPGELNVTRFVNDQPCWRKQVVQSTSKKKSLVIYDWGSPSWSPDKQLKMRDYVTELLAAEFPVYVYVGDEFVKLDKDNLYLLSSLVSNKNASEITDNEALKRQAVNQLKLQKNQIYVLDHQQLNSIYDHGNVETENLIDLIALLNACNHDNEVYQDHLITILQSSSQQSTPALTFASEPGDASLVDNLSHGLPSQQKIIDRIHALLITLSARNYQYKGDKSAISEVMIAGHEIKDIQREILMERLNKDLLESYPRIAGLKFRNITLDNPELLNVNLLHRLQTLELFQSSVSTDVLSSIITNGGQLRELDLLKVDSSKRSTATKVDQGQLVPPNSMPKLEVLNISECQLTGATLNNLLKANDIGLRSLKVSQLANANQVNYDDLHFNQLEELQIEATTLLIIDALTLLGNVPNLKKFTMIGGTWVSRFSDQLASRYSDQLVDEQDSDFTVEKYEAEAQESRDACDKLSFEKLQELEIISEEMDEDFVYEILRKSPSLKKLTLKIQSEDAFLCKFIKSSQLEEFHLQLTNYSHLVDEAFVKIINRSNHLRKLTVFFDNFINIAWRDVNLSRLTELAINNFRPTKLNVDGLFTNLTNLEKLSLAADRDKPLSALYGFPQKNMPNLSEVQLTYYMISSKQLIELIIRSPKLTKIDLTRCYIKISQELIDLLKERNIKFNCEYSISDELLPDLIDDQSIVEKLLVSNKAHVHTSTPDRVATVDADTNPENKETYEIDKIFYPFSADQPEPSAIHYRIDIFNELYINESPCEVADAFKVFNKDNLSLVPCGIPREQEDVFSKSNEFKDTASENFFYGKQTLALTGEWQAIASLSPNEKMLCYHVNKNIDVEIMYSERDNQYYIRSKDTPQTIIFDFVLATPKAKPALPSEIQLHVDEFLRYGNAILNIEKESPTGFDYFDAISSQKLGACRHRMVAFKALFEKQYPQYPVRMVLNASHAYVEVKVDGQWIACDLGGYPANLIINNSNDPHRLPEEPTHDFIEFAEETEIAKDYLLQLRTWEQHPASVSSLEQYCQQQVAIDDNQKRLVKLNSADEIQSLRLALQEHCQSINRPVYYINSPDDLVCGAPYLTRDGNRGQINKGPGGPLYDFLTKNVDPSNPPVIIVNYDNFNADDIVRLNSLIDEVGRVDNTLLPESAIIVGLINPAKPDCYDGSDFYSRFDHVEQCPLNLKLTPLPITEATSVGDSYIIDLFHQENWQSRLLGRWQLQGDQLIYVEGELANAIASGKSIHIKNGSWHDPEFQQFWREITTFGRIDIPGGELVFSPMPAIFKSDGYDWSLLRQSLIISDEYSSTSTILNPSAKQQLFTRYQVDDNKLLELPGFIAAFANQPLHITLTRELSQDDWAAILAECQQHHVELHCYPFLGVRLPAELIQTDLKRHIKQRFESPHTVITYSNDPDAYIKSVLLNQHEEDTWIVLDLSECYSSDLLMKLSGKFDTDTLHYSFTESEQAVLDALNNKKKVILTGRFSAELEDALTSFMLKRQADANATGRLHIVHAQPSQFQVLTTQYELITRNDKLDLLLREFPDEVSKKFIEKELHPLLDAVPYTELKARIIAYHTSHAANIDPWQGMHQLPASIHLEQFNPYTDQSPEILVNAFNQERLDKVNSVLQFSPYVYLAGLTAVGKTTFVEKILGEQPNVDLFRGEDNLRNWAIAPKSDTLKILFIDEANITSREWSEFEGLFNDPPGILINGEYLPLTSQHKVVFAGNPLSYGGERKLPPLFARHGNSVIFEPLPEAFIYSEMIKPIFANTHFANQTPAIAAYLLAVYRYLCQHSTKEVLISPREIQMMALMVRSHQLSHPEDSPNEVARHYAYLLANQLVPAPLLDEFSALFKPLVQLPVHEAELAKQRNQYLVTPSRVAISRHLQDLLNLRELRQADQSASEALRYGGLGGLVLEGEPGIGKSEIVIESLVANGYHEAKLDKDHISDKPFYRLPINMSPDEKKRLLLTAFHQGAVVVIDEINSAPMMERLLNDLLMGKTPEGKRPDRPGFLVIGTQNPASMSGRREMTSALARRMTLVTLPPYTRHEMVAILERKGVENNAAKAMVIAYEKNISLAKINNHQPMPTFRDLMKVAKRYLKANGKYRSPQVIAEDKAKSELLQEVTDEAAILKKEFASLNQFDHVAFRILESIELIRRNKNYQSDYDAWLTQKFVELLDVKSLSDMSSFDEMVDYVSTCERNFLECKNQIRRLNADTNGLLLILKGVQNNKRWSKESVHVANIASFLKQYEKELAKVDLLDFKGVEATCARLRQPLEEYRAEITTLLEKTAKAPKQKQFFGSIIQRFSAILSKDDTRQPDKLQKERKAVTRQREIKKTPRS